MRRAFGILLTVLVVLAAFHVSRADSEGPVVFQISTITALMQGEYDGRTTFAQLKEHGDFGLGTVNGLDGEVIALDGTFFQIRSDGKVYPIDDSEKTPFAVVTFFKPGLVLPLKKATNFAQLQESLDSLVPSTNSLLAVRIDGEFTYLKVRSVPRQQKPYAKLEDALKDETVFELRNVRGSMVGFRFPSCMDGINVAGYHFHFITRDRKAGGHVLDCGFQGLQAEVAGIPRLELVLPGDHPSVKP